jgi:hypothetical protein
MNPVVKNSRASRVTASAIKLGSQQSMVRGQLQKLGARQNKATERPWCRLIDTGTTGTLFRPEKDIGTYT